MKTIYQGPLEGIPSDDGYIEGAKEEFNAALKEAQSTTENLLEEKNPFAIINGVKFDARYLAKLLITLQLVRDGKTSAQELEKMISNQLWAAGDCWRRLRLNLWRLGG